MSQEGATIGGGHTRLVLGDPNLDLPSTEKELRKAFRRPLHPDEILQGLSAKLLKRMVHLANAVNGVQKMEGSLHQEDYFLAMYRLRR
jgi:hypothetical protein